jgi:hypothetical protein
MQTINIIKSEDLTQEIAYAVKADTEILVIPISLLKKLKIYEDCARLSDGYITYSRVNAIKDLSIRNVTTLDFKAFARAGIFLTDNPNISDGVMLYICEFLEKCRFDGKMRVGYQMPNELVEDKSDRKIYDILTNGYKGNRLDIMVSNYDLKVFYLNISHTLDRKCSYKRFRLYDGDIKQLLNWALTIDDDFNFVYKINVIGSRANI